MRITILLITLTLLAGSCNANNSRNTKIQLTEQNNDNKASKEYITQRLNHIYQVAFSDQEHDLLKLDSMFMSQEYNDLQNKALNIAERTQDPIIDADHWVQGQDWTFPTMQVKSIDNITQNTATAHVIITTHMPGNNSEDNEIILSLVFERNDWYIDNMQQYYEGQLLDEKAWYKNYVENDANM